MKKLKILMTALSAFALVACGGNTSKVVEESVETPVSAEPAPNSEEESSALPSFDDAFSVQFELGQHVQLQVFKDQTYSVAQTGPVYKTTLADTGEFSKADGACIHFRLILDTGWKAKVSALEGTFNKVKTPGDMAKENIEGLTVQGNEYKLTKITANTVVTVETTDQPDGFPVTINPVQHATVTVYKDQNYTIVDTDTTYKTRNCKTAPYDYCDDGNDSQFCFKVIPETGWIVDSVVVSPSSAFKNLKEPGTGADDSGYADAWRVTKVKGELTITITVVDANSLQ